MKPKHNVPKPKCYFCPLFKKWFCGLLKLRKGKVRQELALVLEKLDDIEEILGIIARQIARWSKIESGE